MIHIGGAVVLPHCILEVQSEIALAHLCLVDPPLSIACFLEFVVLRIVTENRTQGIAHIAVLDGLIRFTCLIGICIGRKGAIR